MSRDILNLLLRPLHLAVTPKIGLTVRGSIDEVRETARRIKFLRVKGVEIVGREPPINPSCAFLSEIQTLQFVRLFAGPLTDIESLQLLRRLRRLKIEHTTKNQSISMDFGLLRALKNPELEWFQGAESLFRTPKLRSLDLTYYPLSSSEYFIRLPNLMRLRLAASELTEITALGRARRLIWLALLNLNRLESFAGISGHSAIRFIWIEQCSKLRSLVEKT